MTFQEALNKWRDRHCTGRCRGVAQPRWADAPPRSKSPSACSGRHRAQHWVACLWRRGRRHSVAFVWRLPRWHQQVPAMTAPAGAQGLQQPAASAGVLPPQAAPCIVFYSICLVSSGRCMPQATPQPWVRAAGLPACRHQVAGWHTCLRLRGRERICLHTTASSLRTAVARLVVRRFEMLGCLLWCVA